MTLWGLRRRSRAPPLLGANRSPLRCLHRGYPGHNSRDSSHYLCVTSGAHDLSELFPEVEEDYEGEDDQTFADTRVR
jgi:hypothetical protein